MPQGGRTTDSQDELARSSPAEYKVSLFSRTLRKDLRVPVHYYRSQAQQERQTSYQGYQEVARVVAAGCRDGQVKLHDDAATEFPYSKRLFMCKR